MKFFGYDIAGPVGPIVTRVAPLVIDIIRLRKMTFQPSQLRCSSSTHVESARLHKETKENYCYDGFSELGKDPKC